MAIQVTLPNARLVSEGAKIGDQVLLTNAPANMFTGGIPDPNNFKGQFLVTAIKNETDFEFDGFLDGTSLNLTLLHTLNAVTIGYEIVHNLTKDEQIDAILAYATKIAEKRVTLVWPPAALVKNDDGTFTQVDGTFLASILASAKSANPAQQGFTNLPLPGPYELLYSNKYFSKTQLKRLAEGGVLVFKQDAPGANIYALHQRTTDTSAFENVELSCVTTIDKVSADLVAMYKPVIGPYNVTDDYLSLLNHMGDDYFYRAKSVKAPKCGPLVINGKIDSIRAQMNGQNLDIPAGVIEVTVSIEIGKPANWIQIKLLVS